MTILRYGTSNANIRMNFNNIEGKDIAEFKDGVNSGYIIQKCARVIYLWTKRGAARHAKMLNTEKAWEVFEKLEDCYFEQPEKSTQADDTRAILLQILEVVNSSSNAEKILSKLTQAFKQYAHDEQRNGDFERGKTLAKMIFVLKHSPKKEHLADMATNLIVGEKIF